MAGFNPRGAKTGSAAWRANPTVKAALANHEAGFGAKAENGTWKATGFGKKTAAETVFTKTTGKGAVLKVTYNGMNVRATVDGKEIGATVRSVAPRQVGGKTVVAQIGPIGLTAHEHAALLTAITPRRPAPVSKKYEHARSYTRADAAFYRGHERKRTGE